MTSSVSAHAPSPADETLPVSPPPVPAAVTCMRCQFDLAGLSETAACPNCGSPVAPALNRTGRASCIACVYPLVGLPDSGRCPECGTSVELSRYGVLLRSRGVEHLETLRFGIVLILIANLLQLFTWVPVFILGALDDSTAEAFAPVVGLLPVAWLLLGAMAALGWWIFTAPDPRGLETATASASRRLVRAMIVATTTVVLTFVALVVILGLTRSAGAFLTVILLPFFVVPVAIVMGAVWFFASLAYIKWLAVRLPSEPIARRAGLLMWLAPLLATVGSLVLIGPLVALALYLGLLEQVRRQIKLVTPDGPNE